MKTPYDFTITQALVMLGLIVATLAGCSDSATLRVPVAPTTIIAPTPAPTGPIPPVSEELYGTWEGTMSERSRSAQAKLIIGAEVQTLSFQYVEGPPVPDWYNVDTSPVNVTSGENSNAVSFTFLSPNTRGHQGPYCLDGTFEGTLQSMDACNSELTGTYQIKGWSEDCFQPPFGGTFSFRNRRCN
jgi:hypothetical protein